MPIPHGESETWQRDGPNETIFIARPEQTGNKVPTFYVEAGGSNSPLKSHLFNLPETNGNVVNGGVWRFGEDSDMWGLLFIRISLDLYGTSDTPCWFRMPSHYHECRQNSAIGS